MHKKWKKPLAIGLLIMGIVLVVSLAFLVLADFHTIAFVFQLLIPYFLGPVLLAIVPFILIVVMVAIIVRCAVYRRKIKDN